MNQKEHVEEEEEVKVEGNQRNYLSSILFQHFLDGAAFDGK